MRLRLLSRFALLSTSLALFSGALSVGCGPGGGHGTSGTQSSGSGGEAGAGGDGGMGGGGTGSGGGTGGAGGSCEDEICDGLDNDCDGAMDEDLGSTTCGLGACKVIVNNCVGGVLQTCAPLPPSPVDICEGTDDDCDGEVDEGCTCLNGQVQGCYSGPACTGGVGVCTGGTQTCVNGQWAACVGEVLPAQEVCDGIDNDCNGTVDEGSFCCPDGNKNGNETSVDCGGACMQKCPAGASCLANNDCASLVCALGACQAPVCGDGVKNGSEACDDGGTSDGDSCSPLCASQEALALGAGTSHMCALLPGGKVKCWGDNAFGQLGLGDTADRGDGFGEMGSSLQVVNLGTGKVAVQLAVGGFHNCAVFSDNTVKCWGSNYTGKLGLSGGNRGDGPGEMGDSLPALNFGGKTVTKLELGWNHTCAIFSDGSLSCWGSNTEGQLGRGDTVSTPDTFTTINLGTGKTAVDVSCGDSHTCVVLNDGSIKCWGGGVFGKLGLGDTQNRGDGPGEMGDALPTVDLGAGQTAIGVTAGSIHTCALLSGGAVKCWGINNAGQLGLGDTQPRGDGPGEMGSNLPFVDLGTGKTAVQIQGGSEHTCALLDDARLKCWGRNDYGQLGLGDTTWRGDGPAEMGNALPALNLGTGKTVIFASMGANHSCARLNNGSTKCWGYNLEGQLGVGDTSNRADWWSEVGDNLAITKLFSSLW